MTEEDINAVLGIDGIESVTALVVDEQEEDSESSFNREVGGRLRHLREVLGMTLTDVLRVWQNTTKGECHSRTRRDLRGLLRLDPWCERRYRDSDQQQRALALHARKEPANLSRIRQDRG